MPEQEVFNCDNKSVGKVELPQDIFGVEVKSAVLHEVVRNYRANQRQGSAATKTRGDVAGGGKKPFRQKGSGRARAGSNRSPLWRGGGTTFGPEQRDYSYKLPKKMKWVALGSALSKKVSEGEVIVVEDLTIDKPKTKALLSILKVFGIENALIVLSKHNREINLAARNIPGVKVALAGKLNVYEILIHKKLLITREAVERMKEVYLG